ncbi:TetR family transcriptional regulator [Nonomuraea sp. NPDC050328]|uniref:TetR family transcriptional regulator n=1 Tax=Nonomuraea sp. NPDC050328 TaxID=3364361 RepID=UPI0037979770
MGLRERKKEKTRLALLDAALDLFLEQGYEATTIEQIAGVVEVSSRTFFRYFASKEHLALWFHDHSEEVMQAELSARPLDEPPFTSLVHALRATLRDMAESTPDDTERFLKLRKLYDSTPVLVGRSVARGAETEQRLAAEIARRTGRGDDDRLPHLMVAFAMASMRVGFECPINEITDLRELVARMNSTLDLVQRSLVPGWDLARG